jgi:hypothetical protein
MACADSFAQRNEVVDLIVRLGFSRQSVSCQDLSAARWFIELEHATAEARLVARVAPVPLERGRAWAVRAVLVCHS